MSASVNNSGSFFTQSFLSGSNRVEVDGYLTPSDRVRAGYERLKFNLNKPENYSSRKIALNEDLKKELITVIDPLIRNGNLPISLVRTDAAKVLKSNRLTRARAIQLLTDLGYNLQKGQAQPLGAELKSD